VVLVGTALDAQGASGITSRDACLIIAISDVGTRVVLFDPGVNMLHIKGDRFAHAGDLGLQCRDGGIWLQFSGALLFSTLFCLLLLLLLCGGEGVGA